MCYIPTEVTEKQNKTELSPSINFVIDYYFLLQIYTRLARGIQSRCIKYKFKCHTEKYHLQTPF